MEFQGVYTAVLTPFQNQGRTIDFGAYREMLERQIAAGVAGVTPCGTTGESPTLSHEEHSELIRKTVEFVHGRTRVIAGAGSNSTSEAVKLTRDACAAGVDAIMLVNPYYNRPSQEGLYQHFKTVAEASTAPVMIYNIRGRTGVNVETETLARLAELPNIKAVKEASGDPGQMCRVVKRCGGRLAVLSGDDNITPAVMGLGGSGVVSVASNIFPRRMVRMMSHYLNGDFKKGNAEFYELIDFMNALFSETNPVPVKAAAAMRGLCAPHLRLPLTDLDDANRETLRRLLDELGEDR